ncbi:MAG: hypothetical protein R3B48_29305 [Kofleriaceae bacterium]
MDRVAAGARALLDHERAATPAPQADPAHHLIAAIAWHAYQRAIDPRVYAPERAAEVPRSVAREPE